MMEIFLFSLAGGVMANAAWWLLVYVAHLLLARISRFRGKDV